MEMSASVAGQPTDKGSCEAVQIKACTPPYTNPETPANSTWGEFLMTRGLLAVGLQSANCEQVPADNSNLSPGLLPGARLRSAGWSNPS